MNTKTKKDVSYYLLATLGVVLIILPFFFLRVSSEEMVNNAKRLSLHIVTFGAAAISASALSSVVSKAAKSSTLANSGTYVFAAVATTTLVVSAISMNNAVNSTQELVSMQDTTAAINDTTALLATDTSVVYIDSTAKQVENSPESPAPEPRPSFVSNRQTAPIVSEKKAADNTSGDCKESDIGLYVAGKKEDVSKGFSFANRNKNIRIGDQCGCTATNTKISITDASGSLKSEKLLTTPFFTLQSVANLELTDNVSAEVNNMTCLAKDGTKSTKKVNKLLLKFFFKNDIPETTRKRAAKELFVQEETSPTGGKTSILNKASNNTPVQKDKIEEEYNKYGN